MKNRTAIITTAVRFFVQYFKNLLNNTKYQKEKNYKVYPFC